MLFLKWFASRSVRHAWQAARHVEKSLQHQRDLLSADGITALQRDIENVRSACRTADKNAIRDSLAKLEKTANKWLKPYPHSALRENIEVALVAIAVAMGIRTFFLQPFKIPTGSMQPTLFGVTFEDLRGNRDAAIPRGPAAYWSYWFNGISYFSEVAKVSGQLQYDPPTKAVLFNLWQKYRIGDARPERIWFPPDQLFERSGLAQGTPLAVGDEFIKMRVISGDHLFVDRLTYNFRQPSRGEIIVFETHGITRLPRDQQDTYYIKRLVGLGGNRIRIGDDRHLIINGQRLDASTPHFEFVYSFDPKLPPMESEWSGHVNEHVAQQNGRGMLAPNFPDEKAELIVPPRHYLAMGDNTMNSSDGRTWGVFPQEKVIGKSFFVYWPIGKTIYHDKERPSRFGWAQR